ncbi:helix-turn-helix transcriptional regulator [Alicyclobacillus shizuokensis]|uniref:helix-turn-helix transcriptional regulator n=1 Tax=Alicyclobacillus shizuokensis TaxID=392014 RepID=UPI0009FA703C|nr:helix-turn-helix transcriptional regulator [Alicyclobacillus shizuokensis]MCL6626952.1 helix-turn-helix domain-containing protein [Alicyclobacillus shizuokensis]
MSETFARRLRAYRKLKCLTQVELARRAGVSLAVVGGLERGTRSPTPDVVYRICRVLEVDAQELWSRALC